MIKVQKKEIRRIIDQVSGLAFKDSEPYSEKAKVFFEDRYSTILSLLPDVKKTDIGLEVGLSGGVLALSLKRILQLDKLYTLEHPTTCKKFTLKFLNSLKQDNIILEPVDLRIGKLPWKNNAFDFIIFSEVMEHLIPSDIPAIMRELMRILKKGGWILVTTPNIASLIKRINLLRGKNPIEFDLRSHDSATYGHIREYTLSEVIDVLQKEGLIIDKKGYFSIDAKRNIFLQIEATCAAFISSLGNNIFVIVRKK